MFLPAIVIAALCVIACRADEPIERLAPPVHEISPPPPPPPPPPPGTLAQAQLAGPPEELSPLLAPQTEPAVVRLFELTDGAARSTLLGYGIKRSKQLAPGLAALLVDWLSRDNAFVDGGEYRCLGEPFGLNISRGTLVREVVIDCGHVYFTPSRHAGRYVMLAPELNSFIYLLR
jgi:hypothetical protein